jgi:hypothetical protein
MTVTTQAAPNPTPTPTPPAMRPAMDGMRKTALAGGVFYLITFVASIPALLLYKPVLDHADFVLGHGSQTPVLWGAFGELITALAGIGSAVVLYPVARRQSETAAVGFVASRILEASLIVLGLISLLSVVTLRQDVAGGSGASPDSLMTAQHTLVAIHDWTFLFGPAVMASVNAVCLGSVMYRSGLVPRIIPTVGLIGAPVLFASAVAVMFGAYEQVSTPASIATLPVALWEFSLGVWLVVKGFKASGVAALAARSDTVGAADSAR